MHNENSRNKEEALHSFEQITHIFSATTFTFLSHFCENFMPSFFADDETLKESNPKIFASL